MKFKTVNISIPNTLLKSADKQAEVEHRNRSDFFREAIRSYLLEQGYFSPIKKFSPTESRRLLDIGKKFKKRNERFITLSCVFRPQPNQVTDIFSTGKNSAIELTENPPKFRNMGWDLQTLDRAKIVKGKYLEVNNGERKTLRVHRDGQISFVGDETFIGHGVNKNEVNKNHEFSVNGLAVAELITNFIVFSKKMSKHLVDKSGEAIFRIQFHNPNEEKIVLKLVHKKFLFPEKSEAFYAETADQTIFSNFNQESEEKIAYKVLAELFYFFGIRDDEFKYVNLDTKEIDLNSFSN